MYSIRKENKGITLIALVVTIVVLIILAVISINAVLGENGIIRRAEQARLLKSHGEVEEGIKLAYVDYEFEQKTGTTAKVSEETKLASTEVAIKLAAKGESFLEYLIRMTYTDDNGKVIVENLLGHNTGYGIGSGSSDVYKVEPSEDGYELNYYGKEGEKTNLAELGTNSNVEEDDDETASLVPGLYETGSNYTVLLKDWETLKSEGLITVTGDKLSAIDWDIAGDLLISEEVKELGIYYKEEYPYGSGEDPEYTVTALTGIYIPATVSTIPSNAFYMNNKLTTVTISDGVRSIGSYAFSNCSGLTSVTIGNSVTSIEYDAFSNCSELTSVTIPDNVISIGGSAFENTAWYNNQPDGDMYIGKVYYKYKGTMPEGTSIEIREGTVSISNSAMYDCSGLTSIMIPNSVTSIGYSAFVGCSGLTRVTIPDSVTSIGSHAFSGCSGLTSVTISNSLTEISYSTFYGCTSLTNVTIPNSVTKIDSSAFSQCNGLTSVTIGDSVASIGSSAFSGCSSLTNVTIPNSVTSIESYAFSQCNGLTSVTIGDSVASIGSSAFSGCSSLTSVTIESETIASTISYSNHWSSNHLVNYATTIYIKDTIPESSIGSYITNTDNFTKEAESDKDGYVKYTKK